MFNLLAKVAIAIGLLAYLRVDHSHVPSKEKLTQRKINLETSKLLFDKKTGELLQEGWLINGQNLVDSKLEKPEGFFDKTWANLRFRALNIMFVTTPNHYIEILAPLDFGFHQISYVMIIDRQDGSKMLTEL